MGRRSPRPRRAAGRPAVLRRRERRDERRLQQGRVPRPVPEPLRLPLRRRAPATGAARHPPPRPRRARARPCGCAGGRDGAGRPPPETCRIWAPCRIARGWLVFNPPEPAARGEAGSNASPLQRAAAALLEALGAPAGARVSAEALLLADGMFGALDLSAFAWALAREIELGVAPELSPAALRAQVLSSRLVSERERVRAALALPPERRFASPRGAALLASLTPAGCAPLARWTMMRSRGLTQMAWPLPVRGIARFRRFRVNASRSCGVFQTGDTVWHTPQDDDLERRFTRRTGSRRRDRTPTAPGPVHPPAVARRCWGRRRPRRPGRAGAAVPARSARKARPCRAACARGTRPWPRGPRSAHGSSCPRAAPPRCADPPRAARRCWRRQRSRRRGSPPARPAGRRARVPRPAAALQGQDI